MAINHNSANCLILAAKISWIQHSFGITLPFSLRIKNAQHERAYIMKTILKTAAIAAILTGFANSAHAMDFTSLTETGSVQMLHTSYLAPSFGGGGLMPPSLTDNLAAKSTPPKIAIARLHEGRFLPLPDQEAPDWAMLNNNGGAIFSPLSASTHFDILPEIPLNGVDSDNKIDEIRLTAAAENQDYVLIYAVNDGASWGRFGDRDLDATGLSYDDASEAVGDGDAKALLINAYSGKVVGAVTTFAPDMKTLTGLVADMAENVLAKV